MKILVAGASGLVGSALGPALRREGHEVVTLVRRPAGREEEIAWDPTTGELEPARWASYQKLLAEARYQCFMRQRTCC